MKINTYVLSTADLDEQLKRKALQHGIELDAISFVQVEPIREDNLKAELLELSGHRLTAVFTSVNAINAMADVFAKGKPDWNVYCLGNATRQAVLQYFDESQVKGIAHDGAGLAAVIKADLVPDVVFFCGDKRLDALPEFLYKHDIMVREIVVYKTKETPEQLVKHYQAVMFFSPNGVNSFFRVNKLWPHTVLFAIGQTTAGALKSRCQNEIIVGETPSKAHLVDKVIAYFHKEA
jgi:uroporphyrinogen-III synthase